MALEQSLQAHSFLEEPPFSSQYRYAFASSTTHTSTISVSTEARVMIFMQSPNEVFIQESFHDSEETIGKDQLEGEIGGFPKHVFKVIACRCSLWKYICRAAYGAARAYRR